MKKYCLVLLLFTVSCSTPKKNKIFDYKDCPFGEIQWMKVSDSSFNEFGLNVATEINGSIKALSDIISTGESSKLLNIDTKIKKAKEIAKKAEVSQEFYEYYLGKSITLCNIWTTSQLGNVSDSLKKALLNKLAEISIEMDRKTEKASREDHSMLFINSGPGQQINRVQKIYNPKADSLENVLRSRDEREKYLTTTPPRLEGVIGVDSGGVTGHLFLLNEIPIEYDYRIIDVETTLHFAMLKWPEIHPVIKNNPQGIFGYSKLGTFRFDQIIAKDDSFKITYKVRYKSIGQSDFSIPGMSGNLMITAIVNKKGRYYYDIRDGYQGAFRF